MHANDLILNLCLWLLQPLCKNEVYFTIYEWSLLLHNYLQWFIQLFFTGSDGQYAYFESSLPVEQATLLSRTYTMSYCMSFWNSMSGFSSSHVYVGTLEVKIDGGETLWSRSGYRDGWYNDKISVGNNGYPYRVSICGKWLKLFLVVSLNSTAMSIMCLLTQISLLEPIFSCLLSFRMKHYHAQ